MFKLIKLGKIRLTSAVSLQKIQHNSFRNQNQGKGSRILIENYKIWGRELSETCVYTQEEIEKLQNKELQGGYEVQIGKYQKNQQELEKVRKNGLFNMFLADSEQKMLINFEDLQEIANKASDPKITVSKILKQSRELKVFDYNVAQNVALILNQNFQQGKFDVVYDGDFKQLYFHEEMLNYSNIIYNPEFLKKNQVSISSPEFIFNICKLILAKSTFLPNLDLLRQAKKSFGENNDPEKNVVISELMKKIYFRYNNHEKFNYLGFVHDAFYLTRGSYKTEIDLNIFAQKLLNLYWGERNPSKNKKEIFKNQLHDLLFVRYRASLSNYQGIVALLADIFFTTEDYHQALTDVGFMLLMLNRIDKDEDIADILTTIHMNQDEKAFSFYYRKSLPIILNNSKLNKIARNYQQKFEEWEELRASKIKTKDNKQVKFSQDSVLNTNFYLTNCEISYQNRQFIQFNQALFGAYINRLSVEKFYKIRAKGQTTSSIEEEVFSKLDMQKQLALLIQSVESFDYDFKERILQKLQNQEFSDSDLAATLNLILDYHQPLQFYSGPKKPSNSQRQPKKQSILNYIEGIEPATETDDIETLGQDEEVQRLAVGEVEVEGEGEGEGEGEELIGIPEEELVELGSEVEGENLTEEKISLDEILEEETKDQENEFQELDNKQRIHTHEIIRKKKAGYCTFNNNFLRGFCTGRQSNLNQEVETYQDDLDNIQEFESQENKKPGFRGFLIKAKEIDTAVEEQQKEKKQKQELQSVKRPFISKEELQKIRQNIQNKEEKEEKDSKDIKDIKEVKEEKDVKEAKEVKEVKELKDAKGKFSKIQQAVYKEQKKAEIVNEIKQVEVNKEYWRNIIAGIEDQDLVQLKLEEHFLGQKDQNLVQNLISQLVQMNPFVTNHFTNGEILIYKMINQPLTFKQETTEKNLEKLQNLVVTCNTSYGVITKDYNSYLQATVFPYSLGEYGYISLFSTLEKNYKRKNFKRIVAHFVRYNKSVSTPIFNAIVKICDENKIPLTLLEIFYLFGQNNIEINIDSFRNLVSVLKDYKGFSDDIEHVAKVYFSQNNTSGTSKDFQLGLLMPYIKFLVQYEQLEKVMQLYQKFKDFILSRKLQYDDNKSASENQQLQESFKAHHRKICGQYCREFVKIFLEKNLTAQAKFIYEDQVTQKLISQQEDYINGILCNKENAAEVQKLYKEAKAMAQQSGTEVAQDLVFSLFSAINTTPNELGVLFQEILFDYFYSGKIDLTTSTINLIIQTFSRTRQNNEFLGFLKFLNTKTELVLSRKTRDVAFRLLKYSKDEIIKPQIRGYIDQIFTAERLKQGYSSEKGQKTQKKQLTEQEKEELQIKNQKLAQQIKNITSVSEEEKQKQEATNKFVRRFVPQEFQPKQNDEKQGKALGYRKQQNSKTNAMHEMMGL